MGLKMNEGNVDRALRLAGGLALVGATLAGYVGVYGWIGIVPIATGLMGFCPLYTLLGISTCPVSAAEKK